MSTRWFPAGGLLVAALWAAHGHAAAPVAPSAPPLPATPTPAHRAAEFQDDAPEPDGKALFLKNCATCHGERGDGQGVTELDRPARSFQDGGFSYGNTPAAIVRTIANGIPGTPMPAFDSSSTAAERRAMAEYVIALGPPGVVVDPESTELVVHDRPLVVRGLLPPIVEGADAQPRGLLLGTIDGLTFEYRADDVQLLGVRAGRFVDRRDWSGRGGDALRPLGQLVHVVEGGSPRPMFQFQPDLSTGGGDRDQRELYDTRLTGTWVRGDRVGLDYELHLDDAPVLTLREAVGAVGTSVAGGFERTFSHPRGVDLERLPAGSLTLAVGTLAPGDEVVAREGPSADFPVAVIVRRAEGLVETYMLSLDPTPPRDEGIRAYFETRPVPSGANRLDARWVPSGQHSLTLTVLSGTIYEHDLLNTIRAELAR